MKTFLDTYALVEILAANPTAVPYAEEGRTGLYNLYELHVVLSRLRGDAGATDVFRGLRSTAVDPTDDDILAASRFKRAYARSKFSYADALGYAMAQNRALPFVTGDEGFRGLPGVEFIGSKKRRA